MEDVLFQKDVPAASCLNDTLVRKTSKPQGLAKKNWNDLKPTIRELYINQGQTLKQLAKYLEEHHGFRPTKKQLLYRISGWGFEKNVKKSERRAIIEHLGPKLGKAGFEALALRGRTLNESKLNRWMKLEKVSFEGSSVGNTEIGCIPTSVVPFERDFGLANQVSEERAPTQTSHHDEKSDFALQVQETQSISVLRCDDNSFDWNSLDVIGSPRLTKLIGALTIEDCDIPLLDLASNSLGAGDISGSDLMDLCNRCDSAQEENTTSRRPSWSMRLSTSISTSQTFRNFEKTSQSGLQFELYPFPSSTSQSYAAHRWFLSSRSVVPKVSDSECKIKLQKLKHMEDTEIIHLVEAMGARAEEYYYQDCYSTAETWFRRVVRAKKIVNWYKPHQTLWACLRVAKCLELRYQYREAQQLQKGLHATIERIFSADHEISVESRRLNADLLEALGFYAEAEAVRRQLLQIHLNSLGIRHMETINDLESLGDTLGSLWRHQEAQPLFETSLHFRLKKRENLVGYLEDDESILWIICAFARALQNSGRHDESEKVLDYADNSLGDATRRRGWNSFACHLERACIYRVQRRLENSEKILRGLLKYHLDYMVPNTIMDSMLELADILVETGRHSEAASWRKKRYSLHVKTFGLTHHWTMECCEGAGFCYANQSRYDEGKLFFEEVIEMLNLSNEEPDPRTTCVQKVKAWIKELEEMMEDSIDRGSKTSESADSERGPMDTDDGVDYENINDIPDPLDH